MLFLPSRKGNTVDVAQLVRALDCGSRGRRFEPGLPPKKIKPLQRGFFIFIVRCILSNFSLYRYFHRNISKSDSCL